MGRVSRQEQEAQTAEKRARIADMIRVNAPLKSISIATGMHISPLRQKIIPSICAELGLVYTPLNQAKGRYVSPFNTRALKETYNFRYNLAAGLKLYQTSFTPELTRAQLSLATGLTFKAVLRAQDRPFAHEWTILEMTRLAQALGLPTNSLIHDCATRAPDRFPSKGELVFTQPEKLEYHD